MPSPRSSRSLILAWAMSRATTIVPVSFSGVEIGYFDSSARISAIGRLRSTFTPCSAPRPRAILAGDEAGRVAFQLLEPDALAVDPRLDVPVGRTRHADAHRARGAVAGQADHPHVEREVLAAELGADAALAGDLHHLRFQLRVAERLAQPVPLGRQPIEIPRAGELDRLHRGLGGGPADHDRPGGTAGTRPCPASGASRVRNFSRLAG